MMAIGVFISVFKKHFNEMNSGVFLPFYRSTILLSFFPTNDTAKTKNDDIFSNQHPWIEYLHFSIYKMFGFYGNEGYGTILNSTLSQGLVEVRWAKMLVILINVSQTYDLGAVLKLNRE